MVAKQILSTLGIDTADAGSVIITDGDGGVVIGSRATGGITVEGSSASSGVTTLDLYHGPMMIDPDSGYPAIPVASDTTFSAFSCASISNSGGGPGNEWTATLYVRPPGSSFSPVTTFSINT